MKEIKVPVKFVLVLTLVLGFSSEARAGIPTCRSDNDCFDANPCTQDTCSFPICTYSKRVYGDVDNNGIVDLADIQAVLDGFGGNFSAVSLANLDIAPCKKSDGIIDLFDILGVLDAFKGSDNCSCAP